MNRVILDVKELSEILGVSKTTIYSMIRNNEIPHSKIRGRIIFHFPSIEEWVRKGATKKQSGL